jgi:hypothetical protein
MGWREQEETMTRSPRRLREQVRDTVSELPIHAARLAVMGVGRALLLTDRVRKDYQEARKSGLGPVLGRLKDDAENIAGNVVGKVSGNGTAEEAAKSATDSEIAVGKPKPATSPRPAASSPRTKPAAGPPSRPTATSRPKPATTTKPAAASKPAAGAPKPSTTKPAAKAKPAAEAKPAAQAKASPQAKASSQAKAGPAKAGPAKASAKPKAADKPSAPAKPQAKGKTAKDLPVTGYDEATLASVRARLRGLDARQVGELRDYERSHAARADFLRMYENRIAKLKSER